MYLQRLLYVTVGIVVFKTSTRTDEKRRIFGNLYLDGLPSSARKCLWPVNVTVTSAVLVRTSDPGKRVFHKSFLVQRPISNEIRLRRHSAYTVKISGRMVQSPPSEFVVYTVFAGQSTVKNITGRMAVISNHFRAPLVHIKIKL